MELHYYKRTPEPDAQYETWRFDEDYGWRKLPVPNEPGFGEKELTQWFIKSNDEDYQFANKERDACMKWYASLKEEILFNQQGNYRLVREEGWGA